MTEAIVQTLKHWRAALALVGIGVTMGGAAVVGARQYIDAPRMLQTHIEQADSIWASQGRQIRDAHRDHSDVMDRLDRLVCELVRERTGEWPPDCATERILP